MSYGPDIKPTIIPNEAPRPSQPRFEGDIKPTLSKIYLQRERNRLKNRFDKKRRNTDPRKDTLGQTEERQRLANLHAVKAEPESRDVKPDIRGIKPGIGDFKPDISKLRRGSGVINSEDSVTSLVDSDDDDVVFIREVQGRSLRAREPASKTASGAIDKDVHNLGAETTNTLMTTDHAHRSSTSPMLASVNVETSLDRISPEIRVETNLHFESRLLPPPPSGTGDLDVSNLGPDISDAILDTDHPLGPSLLPPLPDCQRGLPQAGIHTLDTSKRVSLPDYPSLPTSRAFRTKNLKRAATSVSHHRNANVRSKRLRRRAGSVVSYGSSGPEDDSDLSDASYRGKPLNKARQRAAWTPNYLVQHRRSVMPSTQVPLDLTEARGIGESGEPGPSSVEIDNPAGISADAPGEKTEESSGDDEYTGAYKGPSLNVISVKAINDRLDRSYAKYETSLEHLRQWSQWWPRTKVVQHHRLDSAEWWLLTLAVHEWWSDLLTAMRAPGHEWRVGMKKHEKEKLKLRVEEYMLSKQQAMLNAKIAMLDKGQSVAVDSVIELSGISRRRTEV